MATAVAPPWPLHSFRIRRNRLRGRTAHAHGPYRRSRSRSPGENDDPPRCPPPAVPPFRPSRIGRRRRGRHAPHDARRARAAPLKIGYSDWPGWVAFHALDKGWFKEAGVDVDFEWFDYSASLDAFSAGKLDAVAATNGDALVTGRPARRT